MTRRLRVLLARPLEPATGRLVVVLGGAVCVGFAVLVGLGLLGPGAPSSPRPIAPSSKPGTEPGAAMPSEPTPLRPSIAPRSSPRPPQDPQDRPGSPAARRAHRELSTHQALQHVPWRRGAVSISLVAARAGKAVLAVRARSLGAARRGWHAFLRRYDDDGRANLPRLVVEEGTAGAPVLGGGRRR